MPIRSGLLDSLSIQLSLLFSLTVACVQLKLLLAKSFIRAQGNEELFIFTFGSDAFHAEG